MYDLWVAIVLGVVEGLTEFLPVSSTGHLILTGYLLAYTGDQAETFEVFIQLGAILAVAILYWRRFMSFFGFEKEQTPTTGRRLSLVHVMLAMLPALILGALFHSAIKTWLFSPHTVIAGLILGGLFMIYAEKRPAYVRTKHLDEVTYRQALSIGLFQCLSLWPGFSRSGATIAGGLLSGANVRTAAEFSFIVAVPMMIAASFYDLWKSYHVLSISDIPFFAVGFVVSFVVAMLAVVSFLRLLQKVSLTVFACYRFVLAGVFGLYLFVF